MKRFACFFLAVSFFTVPVKAQDKTTPTPQWRPVYHFTPLKNWTNDPNGLIYFNGAYHLYNQQNPYENKWGHMSWGHATSTDLVHWKHLPLAMPESTDNGTTWRFSGSAVWDKSNTSGLCKTGGCIVAIYTADQPELKKESQYIAYSNNGGMTFTNYDNNPVIDLQKKDFRDPNVTWNELLKKWLMIVALPRENKVQFYSSVNLKKWDLLSEFGPAGFKGGIWECPSLLQVPVEGKPNRKKWILIVSAGGFNKPMMEYFVGDFDGKTFKNDNPADTALKVDDGDCFYAAIAWNNLPQVKKLIIGWMVPGKQETYPWRGQMSIPRDLTLRQTKYGLRLILRPASVIESELPKISGNKSVQMHNLTVTDKELPLDKNHQLSGNAYWLDASLAADPGTDFGFRIGTGKNKAGDSLSGILIGYDAKKQEWYVDKSHAAVASPDNKKMTVAVDPETMKGRIRLQVLLDKSSLEVFINDGEKVITTYVFPGEKENHLAIFAAGGSMRVQSLKVWDLSHIKNEQAMAGL